MVTYDHHSRKLLRWYASSCPCCRRPLDITVRSRPNESELDESQWRGQAFTAVSNYEILVMIVLFWCFIVLVFFLLASSGLHIALLCHIVTVRLQAFSIKSSFSPVWSQFLEPKKSYTEQLEPSREVAGSASTSHPRYARYAYTCVMWGTNPGYALGAAVLGARLKDWTGCFNGRWSYGCRGIDR